MSASIALSNLRAVTILIVVSFHAFMGYLGSAPARIEAFGEAPYRWVAFPIVDSQRWFGFDAFCAWQYLSMMGLMFFLSGLFVASSLARKGSWTFLAQRLLRLGAPLVLVVFLLMPLAYYPAYRVTAADPGFDAYLQEWLALPFWPIGPQWFLWLLLSYTVLVVLMHRFAPHWGERLVRLVAAAGGSPWRFYFGLVAVTAVAYVPLGLVFSPWSWTNFGPIAFETTRPLFYLVYFLAGYALGAQGIERGLFARDGALARQWATWLGMAVAGFAVWAGASALAFGDWRAAPLAIRMAASLGVVVGCASGCMFMFAVCLRFLRRRVTAFDSLSGNAYRIYLLHYAPVVWLQFALLGVALPAVAKGLLVFGGALTVCWLAAAALGNMPLALRPVIAKRRMRSA
jgi:hypothetical protein